MIRKLQLLLSPDSQFSSSEEVLKGARHMVAMQIAHDPQVRQCLRQIYYERAHLTCSPTKKGMKVSRIPSGQKKLLQRDLLQIKTYDTCQFQVSTKDSFPSSHILVSPADQRSSWAYSL